MFHFVRQFVGEKKTGGVPADESIVQQKKIDRRMISGERVNCTFEFTLSNPDLFMHSKVQISGVIVLNVRGCCIYPEQDMWLDEIERRIPQSDSLKVSNMIITGNDGQQFPLSTMSVRRIRSLTDEHGQGIILRFVNLTDAQLDTLNQITDSYSVKN